MNNKQGLRGRHERGCGSGQQMEKVHGRRMHLELAQSLLQSIGQSIVGRVHGGEHGVVAVVRHLDADQHTGE